MAEYLGREIPFRDTAEQVLLEYLPQRLTRVLDLGTGDGRMLDLVLAQHQNARAVGVDISEPMLRRARARLDRQRTTLHRQDLSRSIVQLGTFDAVVSGLAIHHLRDERKQTLFSEVKRVLRPGGTFVNLDLVASSPDAHARFHAAIGRVEEDPEDRPASLADQLTWLSDAGFEDVDCPFKWRELTLLTARRP